MREYRVEEKSNKRIDKYVCELNPDLTRSAVQRMINEGNILVNGSAVKPSYVACIGDIVTVEEETPVDSDIKPEEILLDVIYEDEDILIINKEKGMVVHPRKWKFKRNFSKCSYGKVQRQFIRYRRQNKTWHSA